MEKIVIEWTRAIVSRGTCIKGNNAIEFIPLVQIPWHKKVDYANMVCDIKQHKTEKHRVRLTNGGNVLDYFEDTSSSAASLIEKS